MENKPDKKFVILQAKNKANKQEMKSNKKDSDDKITKLSE